MGKTLRHEYLGWEIAIRCIERPRAIDEVRTAPRYTASAIATLMPSQSPQDWIDPRAQAITLGNRTFSNDRHCISTLLAEVQELIDALKK
jgi:hypothetical protein